MAVVIVFQYGDDQIDTEHSLGDALAAWRELIDPKPDCIHLAVRESADQVLEVFGVLPGA